MSAAVRSRVFKISAAAATAAIAIGLCLFSQDDVSASIKEHRVERLNAQIEKVKNTITLTITDTDGNATTRTIEQAGPKLLGEEEVRLEQAAPPTNPPIYSRFAASYLRRIRSS